MLKILLLASLALNAIMLLAVWRFKQTRDWWQDRGRRVEDYVNTLREQLDDFYKQEMQQKLSDEQKQFAAEQAKLAEAVKRALDQKIDSK